MERAIVHSDLTKNEIQPQLLLEKYIELVKLDIKHFFPEESLQKVQTLTINIDQFLFNQPYLAQALEETSHVPYGDITEGDLG